MKPLTIRYDVPGVSPHGQLLDEITIQPTLAMNEIAFVFDPAVTVSQRTYETVARATRRVARALALRARSLTLRCTAHSGQRMQTGHDCTTDGDAVLDLTLDRQWLFNLSFAQLRARDLLSGGFPSTHATARVPWVDVLWTLSIEGRLAKRGIVRPNAPERAATPATAGDRARSELLTALIWAGKQRGLSLLKNDAERIARLVWGKNVTLHEIAALGEKFGFRLEGPIASIPLPERWPRQVPARSIREEPAAVS